MIQVKELAVELHRDRSTINHWISDDVHIEKIFVKGSSFITEEDAEIIRKVSAERSSNGGNKSGDHFAKRDINYNWRRGLPTRISY